MVLTRSLREQLGRMESTVNFPPEFGTRFSISVDTEEEFEWAGPLSRDNHGVSAVPALREGQSYFAAAGVRPIYFIDTPVLDSDVAVDIFAQIIADDGADVGVHLHPWVTPPFDEHISRSNSYAGNLPEAIERAKICHVRDLMVEKLGVCPIAYRAGRYGIGPNSFRILEEEGFRCDSSIRSLFDYRDDGGPDFRSAHHHPHVIGPNASMIELPLTGVYIGRWGDAGRRLFGVVGHVGFMRSALARSGLIERIPLTPEGIPADKACRAIDTALDIGIRVLTMSFHSPSLAPGYTPYVRDASGLRAFYGWFDIVFNHCAKRGITAASLDAILKAAALPT